MENTMKQTLRTETRRDAYASYRYDLFMREGEEVANFGLPLYAVRIEMTGSEDNPEAFSTTTADVSSDRNRAMQFFDKIVDGRATPMNLPFLVQDEGIS